MKRAAEAGIPSKLLRTLEDILEFPAGWKYVKNTEVDGVLVIHGEEVSGRAAAASLVQLYRRNVICGHLHGQATIQYLNNGDKTCFGAVAGCLVDDKAYAFAYGTHSKDKPVVGVFILDDGTPRFIPFYVPKGGRR
jgi:hypothetical protein